VNSETRRYQVPPLPRSPSSIAPTSECGGEGRGEGVATRTFGCLALAFAILSGNPAPAAVQPVWENQLVFLDGREVLDSVARIDAAGKVHLKRAAEPVPLNGLRLVRHVMFRKPPVKMSAVGSIVVRLTGDGSIRAKTVAIKSEKVYVTWAGGPELKLPLEAVRSVQFQTAPNPLFAKAAASPSADNDQLIVEIRNKFRAVPALIESMDDAQITFTSDKQKISVPRQRLYGVVFAYVKKPLKRDGLCRVRLTDGTILPGKVLELPKVPGRLKFQLLEGSELSLDWDAVAQIAVSSDRLHWVSDLKPAEVVEQTIVALPQKWKADQSVAGTRLKLAGRTFDKGLGVHARSQLTFALDGKYETFAAVIGLDDAARRKGDCVFVVSGDGRELFRQRVKGRDKPAAVRLDVRNVRRLVLLVEPGENLDIADHADWADACLILPAK
jgi:NPCBM/NEW2 domain